MTLFRAVWKLLRAQWWIWLNNFRRAKGRARLGYVVFAIFLLGLAAGAFALSRAMLSALRDPRALTWFDATGLGNPMAVIEGVPLLVLSGVFLLTFIFSFQVLLQVLYLSGDMDFLLSSPLPARAVFVAKLLQAVFPNFALFSLFTLPLLWGLGAAYGYSAIYYPLVPLCLALQTLAAAGLSALLVITVVRVFPARRVFEVISFLSAMIGMLCSQWYNLSRGFGRGVESDPVGPAVGRVTGVIARLSVPWSPMAWPGLGLRALVRGEWLPALAYFVLSVGLAGGVFLLSLSVAERLYYSGWFRVRVVPGRRPKRAAARPARHGRVGRLPLFSPPVWSIVLKDFRMLQRDLRNLSQLLSPVIFALIYAVMIFRSRSAMDTRVATAMQHYSFYLAIFVALFACWGLTTRLAAMGFSQESQCYWILKTAPLRPAQLALAKWLVAFIPGAVLGSALLVGLGIVQRASAGDLLFGWPVVVMVVAGNTGLNLAFGITGARLDWTDPRQMVSGSAGCLASLLGMGFQSLSMAFFLGPVLITQALHWPVLIGQLTGLLVGGIFCAGVAVLPPLLVLQRIPLIGE
jgi:ABC-2 type transport system permease protein